MKKLFLGTLIGATVLLALSHGAPAFAETPEWLYIDTTKEGTKTYARTEDLANGRPSSRAARLWVKMDASKDSTVSFNELKTMYVVDCVTDTYRAVTLQVYYPNGKTDTIPGDNKIEHIVPESVMAAITGVLCAPPEGGSSDASYIQA